MGRTARRKRENRQLERHLSTPGTMQVAGCKHCDFFAIVDTGPALLPALQEAERRAAENGECLADIWPDVLKALGVKDKTEKLLFMYAVMEGLNAAVEEDKARREKRS